MLLRERHAAVAAILLVFTILPARVEAAGDPSATKGLALAKKGDCPAAIPFLEDAELAHHRPTTSIALANCYVATAQLIRADDTYHALADEQPQKFWTKADYAAQKQAADKAAEIDARIPTLRFDGADKYEELEVEINGKPVASPGKERKVPPDTSLVVVVRAKDHQDYKTRLVLNEGDRKVIKLKLEKVGDAKFEETPDKPVEPPPSKDKAPTTWLGVRYRGVILPQFVVSAFVDGGSTVFVPGGALTLTTRAGDTDVVMSLGYMDYQMPEVAMKPKNSPDTDWEYVSAGLQTLTATVDLMWTVPLDQKGSVSFRIGGGLGVGVTLAGDITRVQSYPANLKPGDPNTYLHCKGPNNPFGTYRYCNKLDNDATHYPGYTEPSWFSGGLKPTVFPWAVLPELGLTFKTSQTVAIDVETGITLNGFLTSAGFRFGL